MGDVYICYRSVEPTRGRQKKCQSWNEESASPGFSPLWPHVYYIRGRRRAVLRGWHGGPTTHTPAARRHGWVIIPLIEIKTNPQDVLVYSYYLLVPSIVCPQSSFLLKGNLFLRDVLCASFIFLHKVISYWKKTNPQECITPDSMCFFQLSS